MVVEVNSQSEVRVEVEPFHEFKTIRLYQSHYLEDGTRQDHCIKMLDKDLERIRKIVEAE